MTSTKPKNVHPQIRTIRGKSYKGRTSNLQQRATCGKCDKRITATVSDGNLKSVKDFIAFAHQRGWDYDPMDGLFFCPNHKETTEETMTNTPPTTPAPSESKPREMTTEKRRAIFREIDESYDRDGYCLDVTDQTIAAKLGVPWGWVAKIRSEMFGPAGPDPKIKALAAKVSDAEKSAQKAYERAMAAAQTADEAMAEAKSLREQLVSLLQR